LGTVRKLSEDEVERLISRLSGGNELGVLRIDEEETPKPWETVKIPLNRDDFPRKIEIVKANMLYVPKAGLSQRGLNRLKRLAAFKNPEFYKAQAMRLPTYGKWRIIACADETADYLCLPRGCEMDLKAMFSEQGTEITSIDNTTCGRKIDVEFIGSLRDEQPLAIDQLLSHDIGVLSGTTAFGKTVVAIKLIAERKVNTLIIVNRASLVSQWTKRLMEFLAIRETLPATDADGEKRRGRKKIRTVIGQLGQGKSILGGIIDIALMQSLGRMGEVKELVKNYGMIIVDECHHVAAFSFESIVKNASAKYICGLTATPTRKDGHHPIIFMQCGPVRYRDDAKKQAEKRPFEHYVIPRFTALRVPMDKDERDVSIQEHYGEIAVNEMRNQLIIDDVTQCHENGRNCLVLTERTAHVALLAEKLKEQIPGVISLTGGRGAKETGEIFKQIADTPRDKQLTLIATGRYIGEGFDEPRLDTLFLTMPISWKGTLQQYAGRLHRLYDSKKEVLIYDYVDVHVRMFEKMYHKRLNGYASIGYKAKGGFTEPDSINIIFNKSNFSPVYGNDILAAEREILIVSPFVTRKRTMEMMQHLEVALRNKVRVTVMTRPAEDYRTKDAATLQGILDLLQGAGVCLICRSNIHQKFAIIDQRIVWYGSINLLSFGNAEESIMRLESPNIAHELVKSLESD
jgi:superfamily II DNA or RNA helicase